MKLPTISASQLSDFTMCERKWGFRKLNGLPSPENPAAAKGKEIHSHLEAWLEKGTPIDVNKATGRCALALVPSLPPPGTGLLIERDYMIERSKGLVYFGRKDLEYVRNDVDVIRDHKSTKDLKWAKTPDELLTDFQAMQYAASVLLPSFKKKKVELEWGYVTTGDTKPKTKIVRLEVFRDHVEDQIHEQDKIAHKLLDAHRRGLKAEDLEPNYDACGAYGGCPYLSVCHGKGTEEKMSAIEQLKSRLAAQAKANGHKGINPPEKKTEEEAKPQEESILDRHRNEHDQELAAIKTYQDKNAPAPKLDVLKEKLAATAPKREEIRERQRQQAEVEREWYTINPSDYEFFEKVLLTLIAKPGGLDVTPDLLVTRALEIVSQVKRHAK